MKVLIVLVALLTPTICLSAIDSIKTNTKITDVTVFFSGAQVTRFENLNLTKGKHLIILNKLPEEIHAQSIQVQKMNNCKILSVKHTLDYSASSIKSQKERNIEDLIKAEKRKLKELKMKAQVFEIEEKLLLDNSNFSQKEAGASIDEIKKAADYYRQRLNEIRTEILKLSDEAEEINETILDFYEDLNEITVEKKQTYSRIIIAIESDVQTKSELKVSYYIASAGWSPLYDFRVENISLPLKIVYNANVYQSSGEDWENVNIKLSTNNPSLSGSKPKIVRLFANQLDPYYAEKSESNAVGALKGRVLDKETGEPLPFANVSIENDGSTQGGSITDFDGLYSIKPVKPGTYTLKVSYVGFTPVAITGVKVNSDQITFLNAEMSSAGSLALKSYEKVEYSESLIKTDDNKMGGTISQEQFNRLPTRSVAGAFSDYDNMEDDPYRIRGSRTKGNQPYIDGIKVRGNEDKEMSYLSTNYISNTIRTAVANMEYVIKIPYNIPSDGEDYNIKIKELITPTEYVFYAVPKLETETFLTAQVANWTKLNLISGVAYIFYQGTYVAESYMDAYQSSDTLEISLGRDRNIVISRISNKEQRERKLSGNQIKETIVLDISIMNKRKSPIKVVIEDQYPLSQRKSIQIELLTSQGAKVEPKTGFLNWEMTLDPDQKREVSFSYSVKYYKGLDLNLE